MYTTQGEMTYVDLADHQELTDTGTITVHLDNPPLWWFPPANDRCPVCDGRVIAHDSVTVVRASGEIVACIDLDGKRSELPQPAEDYWG